jgi:hypothetical protein
MIRAERDVPMWLTHFLLMTGVLALIAALSPVPSYQTDRETYEKIGRQLIVPDCSSLHCSRKLVAWVVENLPGPSRAKWKAYSVLANAGAGAAVIALSLALQFSARGALLAGWTSALGFGSLFTLFDPHTSDPLMYLLGPLLTLLLVTDRTRMAGWLAAVGVLAKEFAVAPLWIFALAEAAARRWVEAARVLTMAAAVTLLWISLQLFLILAFNYSYAGSASADVFGGGYLRLWATYVSPRVAAATIFGELGALFLLIPVGFLRSGPDLRRFALASLPAVLALAYVQQPDRALWNFHFVAVPLAMVVLERSPAVVGWLFVVCFAIANLRIGAQLTVVPSARFALAATVVLAVLAIVIDLRGRPAGERQLQVSTS